MAHFIPLLLTVLLGYLAIQPVQTAPAVTPVTTTPIETTLYSECTDFADSEGLPAVPTDSHVSLSTNSSLDEPLPSAHRSIIPVDLQAVLQDNAHTVTQMFVPDVTHGPTLAVVFPSDPTIGTTATVADLVKVAHVKEKRQGNTTPAPPPENFSTVPLTLIPDQTWGEFPDETSTATSTRASVRTSTYRTRQEIVAAAATHTVLPVSGSSEPVRYTTAAAVTTEDPRLVRFKTTPVPSPSDPRLVRFSTTPIPLPTRS